MSTHPRRLLAATLIALSLLSACKREETPAPAKPVAKAPSQPERTREQAIAELMALPEVQAWSAQIEKASHGKAHGAVIEYDPAPQMVNGKAYYQLSFVENHQDRVHRRANFLVSRQGDEILVEDEESGSVQSLGEWRRGVRKIELKG